MKKIVFQYRFVFIAIGAAIILFAPIASWMMENHIIFIKKFIKTPISEFFFIFFMNAFFFGIIAYFPPSVVVIKKFKEKKEIFFHCCVFPLTIFLVPIARDLYFVFNSKKNLPDLFYKVFFLEVILGLFSYMIAINFYNKWKNSDFNDLKKMKEIFFNNLNIKFFLVIVLFTMLTAYLEMFYYK